MNANYERYLNDEEFRTRILAAAQRERARAIGGFFARAFRLDRKAANAPRAHLPRQR
jgi:hypothetical protein